MKFTLVIILVLLFTFAINAEAVSQAKKKTSKCIPANCVRRGPKVKVYIQKTCVDKRVSKCHKRKRCCKIEKRCLFNAFCQTKKKKCFWQGKPFKIDNCKPKRRVCRRVNKRTHKVIVVRKRLHKKHKKQVKKVRVIKIKKLKKRKLTKKQKKILKIIKKRKEKKKKALKKVLKKKKQVVLKRNQVVCELYADPHVKGFNKKNFEAQTEGDWVLYRGPNLGAHYRGKRFGAWVGPIKFGIRLYHHRIFTTDFAFNSLKIDGKVVKINNGVLKLGKRATITRNNNKLTFSTNEGEDIDIVSYGWFFNAYVRSRAEKVTGICSQKFIRSKFFNHPHVVKDKKIKLPKCPKRKSYIARCRKMGHLNKFALRGCVFDFCAGLKKSIEKRMLKRNKKELKKKVVIKKRLIKDLRVQRITCELYADPHVKGFNRKYFEAQTVGDWILYKGRNLSAHYRGKSFGSWVGPIKFGVRLFTYRIFSVGFKFDKLKINGKVRKIIEGVTKLKKGGLIKKAGNKITFSTNDGEEVDWVSYNTFFNAYVRSNIPKISGICSEQFIKSHFFKHYHQARMIKVVKRKCHNKKHKIQTCKKRGLTGKKLKFCIEDLCNGLPKAIEKRILKRNKKETIKKAKPIKVEKRVQRITCELYADPHVHGFNNKRYEAQTVGDWVLYRGKNLSAHYRGKRFGSWVGPIKFGVRLYHDRIYSVGFAFDKLKINGEVRNIPVGTTKIGKKGEITRIGNKITFSTGDGEAVDFITFNWFFNAYVRSNVEKVSGICSQQFIKSTFFNHPHKAKKIIAQKLDCPRKMEHRQTCLRRGIKGVALKFCIVDLCNGLPKRIEKKILKNNKTEKKKEAPRKRVKRQQCQVYADPHVHGFNGRNFDAQVDGDWVLYRGLHLSVHYRGKRFGSWVGQVQWGAYLYGQRIASRGFDVRQVNIDGQDITLKNGRNKLPKGGYLDVNGNKITISTGDGEEVDFVSFNWFFNSFARSDVETVSGICNQQFVKSKFFTSPINGKVQHTHQKLCDRRDRFDSRCRRHGLFGAKLINCVFDFCQGLSKEMEKKLIKNVKHEKKIVLPVHHKKWFKRVVKAIAQHKAIHMRRVVGPVFHVHKNFFRRR